MNSTVHKKGRVATRSKPATKVIKSELYRRLREATEDSAVVSGLTHDFYRYPARFSPTFASSAIADLSSPGNVVLDPFMGGGTTIVEALAAGRKAVGNDCNSLSVFLARAKTTILTQKEQDEVRAWFMRIADGLNYRHPREELRCLLNDPRTKNLVWRQLYFPVTTIKTPTRHGCC